MSHEFETQNNTQVVYFFLGPKSFCLKEVKRCTGEKVVVLFNVFNFFLKKEKSQNFQDKIREQSGGSCGWQMRQSNFAFNKV